MNNKHLSSKFDILTFSWKAIILKSKQWRNKPDEVAFLRALPDGISAHWGRQYKVKVKLVTFLHWNRQIL